MIIEAIFSLLVTEIYRVSKDYLKRQGGNDACVDIRYLMVKRC